METFVLKKSLDFIFHSWLPFRSKKVGKGFSRSTRDRSASTIVSYVASKAKIINQKEAELCPVSFATA